MKHGCLFVFAFSILAAAGQAAVNWHTILKQPANWYGTKEARSIADSVLLYQTDSGGWPKNVDMTQPPSAEFLANTAPDHRWPTIDNNATTTQIRLLALVVTTATKDPRYITAVERGIDYLLASQYDSGGWPQFFPLRTGYYTHITYNDDAMANVLTLLRDVSEGAAPFTFLDKPRQARAAAAVAHGVECIVRTQVKQNGKLTAWCAQHDETTFAPAWARNFEPPSLSGEESVGIVKFLMSLKQPTPEIIAAVEGAVTWLRASPIAGLRVENFTGAEGKPDRRAVADPAAPPLWARFYELGTNRAIFIGRDRVIRYDFNEIERERRAGYRYLGDWPAELLAKTYPRWKKKPPQP